MSFMSSLYSFSNNFNVSSSLDPSDLDQINDQSNSQSYSPKPYPVSNPILFIASALRT